MNENACGEVHLKSAPTCSKSRAGLHSRRCLLSPAAFWSILPSGATGFVLSNNRRLTTILIGFALAAAISILAYRQLSSFNWVRFAEVFRSLDPLWLIAGAAAGLLTYVIRALRWQVMLRPVTRSSFRNLLSATLVGFTAVAILGRAGELVRPYLIAKKEKTSIPAQATLWFLERIYDLLSVLLIFSIGLTQIHASQLVPGSSLEWILSMGGWIVGVGVLIAAGVLWVLSRHRDTLKSRATALVDVLPPSVHGKLTRLLDSLHHGASCMNSPAVLFQTMGWTLVEWATIITSFWCYFQAFPATQSFGLVACSIFIGFVSLGAIVQLPGIGGGMQIASIVVLTELFRLPVEPATGLALVLWAGSFLLVVPFGLILALREGLNWKKIKEIEKEAGL